MGVRVRAPLGNSTGGGRVGIALGEGGELDGVTLKSIVEVVDETCPLPEDLMRTLEWFGHNWFLGLGMSLKTLLPARFLQGEELAPLPPRQVSNSSRSASVRYMFDPTDAKRFSAYAGMLEESVLGSLVLFPEVAVAKNFWNSLPARLQSRGLLWPETGPVKQWKLWQSVRLGEFSFIVGSAGASFLPMPEVRRIIVDDESSAAWCTQKHPEFHRRSLLAERARNAGAELVLGGRMPSAKVALRNKNDAFAGKGLGKRAIFVNMYDAKGYEALDIKDKLPISAPLVRETYRALEAGKFAMWILDRKGYAGEIYCDDCGSAVYCSRCGRVMRWEAKKGRLYCLMCGSLQDIPETCPSCSGGFLAGQRPGIEAVAAKAEAVFRSRGSVVLFDDKINPTELQDKYRNGALLIGTRKIIALADELDVAMAGWLDADGEARSPEYDCRARVFGLIWESAWRGVNPRERTVVVQSRRPGKGWQYDLSSGWGSFWQRELKERKLLDLPPFSPMLKIVMPRGKGPEFSRILTSMDVDFWEPEDKNDELWVRTRRFEPLRTALTPYFSIRSTRAGMPAVTLYLD